MTPSPPPMSPSCPTMGDTRTDRVVVHSRPQREAPARRCPRSELRAASASLIPLNEAQSPIVPAPGGAYQGATPTRRSLPAVPPRTRLQCRECTCTLRLCTPTKLQRAMR